MSGKEWHECLTIPVKRKFNSTDVIDVLTDLFLLRGVPGLILSYNEPEFVAETARNWIHAVGTKAIYIKPNSLWENGYCESFNARFKDELLNGKVFYTFERGTNYHREMSETLQHEEATQCSRLPPTEF